MLRCREVVCMCIQDEDGETYKLGMRLDNSDDKYAVRQQFVLDHDALSFLRRIIKLSKSISEVSGGDLQNHELNVEPEDFSVDDLEHGEVNLTVAQILVEAKFDKFDDFPAGIVRAILQHSPRFERPSLT